MRQHDIIDMVRSLTGDILPVGDEALDAGKLDNLKEVGGLLQYLLAQVYNAWKAGEGEVSREAGEILSNLTAFHGDKAINVTGGLLKLTGEEEEAITYAAYQLDEAVTYGDLMDGEREIARDHLTTLLFLIDRINLKK